MNRLIFAGNWKMHMGPQTAREFMRVFLQRYRKAPDAEVWLFPPAASLGVIAEACKDRPEIRVGAQNVHWESHGAFTGETSIAMVAEAGGNVSLVGHSERRHVFGETDEATGKKVRALLAERFTPVLCVGEKIEDREAGNTLEVVCRQLEVLVGLDATQLGEIVIAYEPVWAIGTGRVATPEDAQQVHSYIKSWYRDHGAADPPVLYGGSVKTTNVADLLAQPALDGVLVGGASLDPHAWSELVAQRPRGA
ncbi:MAG: triose-phosphate isomerase [Gemmatimonadales bacterium]